MIDKRLYYRLVGCKENDDGTFTPILLRKSTCYIQVVSEDRRIAEFKPIEK